MPTPHPGEETRREWLRRCIPVVLDDGTAEDNDQAVAICSTMWRDATKGTPMKRFVTAFEIKSLKDREIEGYGATFGNVDHGGDIVMPGAFHKSLRAHMKAGTMPKMLWNHDSQSPPIGVWKLMEEDDNGLHMIGEFADTQMGGDVRTLAQMKAIDSMSIGYIAVDVAFDKEGNRLLKEIDLWEVSPVNFPMNPRAIIQAAKAMTNPRQLERELREGGYTKRQAREAVHKVFSRREAENLPIESGCDADDLEAFVKTANEVAQKLLIASLVLPKFN